MRSCQVVSSPGLGGASQGARLVPTTFRPLPYSTKPLPVRVWTHPRQPGFGSSALRDFGPNDTRTTPKTVFER